MMRLATVDAAALTRLLERYGLCMQVLADRVPIPGSYWGGSEAGLQGERLLARPDTPLHSILHESAHYICMDAQRRAQLARDAGGDDAEESAVCYLQVLMAEALPGLPTWMTGDTASGLDQPPPGSRMTPRMRRRGWCVPASSTAAGRSPGGAAASCETIPAAC